MKKSFIKKIAVYMVFFQLFSPSANASSFKLVDESNKDNPIYEKYDENTKEYSNISIFDEDNITSNQYGADQDVFRRKFDDLIQDPLIYEEVQKRFPEKNFENHEDAIYYYRLFFNLIYANGCGYAAGTNYIFKLFEGREKEFYNTFGFPMYKVVDDKIDFNYELMMLKFFNFHIIDSKINIEDGYQEIYDEINHKFYEHKIMEFLENNPAPRLNDYDYMNWTEKEEKEFNEKVKVHDERLHELYKLSESYKTVHHDLGIKGTASFGHINQFLKIHGVNVDVFAVYDYTDVDLDDLLLPTNFKLYELDELGNYTTCKDVDSHWVYVTDIKDGKIYVSSWGNKYGLDTSESNYQDKVILKLSK